MPVVIDKDLCIECEECVNICPFGSLELGPSGLECSDTCTLCGICLDVCPSEALTLPDVPEEEIDLKDYKDVWIYGEQKRGSLHPVVLELIGVGRELARKRNCRLGVVSIGNRLDQVLATLKHYDVDDIFLIQHQQLKDYNSEIYANLLTDLIREKKPEIILSGATLRGRSLIPRVAVKVRTGLTADCTELDVDENTGNLLQTRPAFGGNIMATIECPNRRPQMATVRPRVMKTASPLPSPHKNQVVQNIDPLLSSLRSETEILDTVDSLKETEDLTEAGIIVAGGRGVGAPKGFRLLERFAKVIGGVIGASRAAVDAGWVPYSRQVGQTGRTVHPDIYFACGISGAVQHLVGMQSSKIIVAINKDKDAPIFNYADYGIVADMFEVIPELIKYAERRVKR
nr:electron transfer flavoprotein subunit alpha [Desulfobacterales bacterium]